MSEVIENHATLKLPKVFMSGSFEGEVQKQINKSLNRRTHTGPQQTQIERKTFFADLRRNFINIIRKALHQTTIKHLCMFDY